MYSTKFYLSLFGIDTYVAPGYIIRVVNGRGVFIAMDCVGYGVYSFWLAYIITNDGALRRKILYCLFGVALLWFINSVRISLYLVALNKGWPMPLGLDHHTWFNIFAYLFIFLLIWQHEKTRKK